MRQETVLALIDQIYAAACDQDQWSSFLGALTEAVGGSGASIAFSQFNGRHTAIGAGVGVFGTDFQREYPAFAHEDPWLRRAQGGRLWKAGTVGLGESLVPMGELKRTAFYNDFGRRHEYIGGVASIVAADAAGIAAVSCCPRTTEVFGSPEVLLMQALMPHLQRALQVHTRIAVAQARAASMSEALDRLETGAALLSSDGHVLFANVSARQTLEAEDGISVDRGTLRPDRPSEATMLRALIAGAAQATSPDAVLAGGVLLLSRPSGRRALQVLVSPVRTADEFIDPRAHVIVFITDPERTPELDLDVLRRIHGLGRAEAGVARLLLQDRTVQEIAELQGIRVNTVRFHLKQLFAKTGTHRQSELVRVLLTTAQVRAAKGSRPFEDV